MTDFKVGDKIRRIIESDWPYQFGVVGKVYTVLKLSDTGNPIIFKYGIGADKNCFELVEEEKPMSETDAIILRHTGSQWEVAPQITPEEAAQMIKDCGVITRKIHAIKLVRQMTWCGLKEAKNAVESVIDFDSEFHNTIAKLKEMLGKL